MWNEMIAEIHGIIMWPVPASCVHCESSTQAALVSKSGGRSPSCELTFRDGKGGSDSYWLASLEISKNKTQQNNTPPSWILALAQAFLFRSCLCQAALPMCRCWAPVCSESLSEGQSGILNGCTVLGFENWILAVEMHNNALSFQVPAVLSFP